MASSDSLAAARHHVIKAGAETVHWGYFSRLLKPVLSVKSGELVTIETLTHHAYDDRARMIAGDPGAESVFGWTKDVKNVDRRGAGPIDASIHGRGAGEGFGVHICTGPVFVDDAGSSMCGRAAAPIHNSLGAPLAATRPPGGAFITTTC
jgi:hypothetical protein